MDSSPTPRNQTQRGESHQTARMCSMNGVRKAAQLRTHHGKTDSSTQSVAVGTCADVSHGHIVPVHNFTVEKERLGVLHEDLQQALTRDATRLSCRTDFSAEGQRGLATRQHVCNGTTHLFSLHLVLPKERYLLQTSGGSQLRMCATHHAHEPTRPIEPC